MKPDEVKNCLRQYRECTARCGFLKMEVEELQALAARLKSSEIEDSISITQKWSVLPHGSSVGDPTASLAQRIADGETPEHLKTLEREIAGRQEEYRKNAAVVTYVDSWMRVLNERERFVVNEHSLKGEFWRGVVNEFQNRFGEIYSVQGLKKIHARAIEKICRIAA